MSKLNAPKINDILAAFYGDTFQVLFAHDITVAASQVIGFALIIKDMYNNIVFSKLNFQPEKFNLDQGMVTFVFDKTETDLLNIGFFYKVQLAYINEGNEIGYYSNVGTTKYSAKPEVYIANLNQSTLNSVQSKYIGVFNSVNDRTEKLYSSYFIIKDTLNNIVFKSEPKIHSSSEDVGAEQTETILIQYNFQMSEKYTIQFFINSINGLIEESPVYDIVKQETLDAGFEGEIMAECDEEEGFVTVTIKQKNNTIVSGKFVLSRTCMDTNERIVLKYLNLSSYQLTKWSFKDYLIEYGKTYQYNLQQYNDRQLYSNDISSNIITVYYDHMFLYDGDKQLKIKYDPNISSFKEVVLEQKVETLGNKFPYIFRNGNVSYKELSLSGLLSYLSDNDQYFFSNGQKDFVNKDIIFKPKEIYQIEKDWKLQVLSWLNNGQVKLLKSPTEGMYLVRLFNISLAPKESLSRMIHTFSATAYEVDEKTSDTYLQYGLLNLEPEEYRSFTYASIDLKEIKIPPNSETGVVINTTWGNVYSIFVQDMLPGEKIQIRMADSNEFETIIIGATGAYVIDDIDIAEIKILKQQYQGIVTIKYMEKIKNFSEIDSIVFHPTHIFSILGDFSFNTLTGFSSIYFLQDNKKYRIQKINLMHFEKRPLVVLNQNLTSSQLNFDDYCIYYQNSFINDTTHSTLWSTKEGCSFVDEQLQQVFDNLYSIRINYKDNSPPTIIDLTDKISYNLSKDIFENILGIEIGFGIKIDLSFDLKENIYNFENKEEFKEDKNVIAFKNNPNENTYNNYIKTIEVWGYKTDNE